MAGKTRKQKSKTLTIPQLRKSFDHIDAWVESHVRKGKKIVKDLVPAFQAEWRKTFHRDVNSKAAEAYLALKHKAAPRMTKKQRGGSASIQPSGAPLDYTTRQGVYGVYGNFPQYVSSGLTFYNQINQDSLTANCGKENITPALPADMGSNAVQKGGKRGSKSRKHGRKGGKTRKGRKGQRGGGAAQDTLASVRSTLDVMTSRPFPGSAPPSTAFIQEMGLKGVTVGPSHPSTQAFTPAPYDPAGYTNAPALISQNLPAQLRAPMY
jgi:hypothetical protein